MGANREQQSLQSKAQGKMAAPAGDKTLAELAPRYGVHSTMISVWKQVLAHQIPAGLDQH
jgi:transposase-like protein